MSRRVFSTCLNLEPKVFNFSVGGVVACAICFVIIGFWQGLLYGLAGGGVGFGVGSWLSKQWFMGQVQRKIYWHLPEARVFIDKNCPESHERKLM